jgi:capsular polysaccharide biosynthesis protein
MADLRESKAVDLSCQVYRRLLLAYPRNHRQAYGAAMLQLFRDQCRDAWAAQHARGLIGCWLRALVDLLKTSLLEHLSNLNPSRIMPFSFRPTIKPLPAFFGICAVVFLPIFFSILVVTFIMPESFRGTATVLVTRPTSSPDSNWTLTEVQVVYSSVVLERVAKSLSLDYVWGKKYNNGTPLKLADVVQILKSRLEIFVIKPDKTDSVPFRINAYSDNPDEAARIANSIVDAYRSFRLEQNRQAGATSRERMVTVLDTAVPQLHAVRPNKPLNIVIGALFGVLVAVIIAPLVLGFFAWIKNRRTVSGVPQKV